MVLIVSFRCDSGNDQLASSRIAGHQMRLDEAERDPEIGIHEVVVNMNRRSAVCSSEIAMLPNGSRIIADNSVGSGNFGADNLIHFGRRGGSMQARCDQNCHSVPADSRSVKPIEQRRQRYGIRRRTRYVAHHDDDSLLAFGKVAKWRRRQRIVESLLQRAVRIGERLYIPALKDSAIRWCPGLPPRCRFCRMQMSSSFWSGPQCRAMINARSSSAALLLSANLHKRDHEWF